MTERKSSAYAGPKEWRSRYRHRTFGALYSRVMRDLAEIGISSIDEYQRYREVRDYFVDYDRLKEIEFAAAHNMQQLIPHLRQQLTTADGLSLLVAEPQASLNNDHKKKVVAFTHATVLQADGVDLHDSEELYDDRRHHITVEFTNGPDLSGCLSLAYDNAYEVKNGILVPVPKRVRLLDPVAFLRADEEIKATAVSQRLTEDELVDLELDRWNSAERMVNLSDHLLHLSLGELGAESSDSSLRIGVAMPSLEEVTLANVRKLRTELRAPFVRFQRELKRFSREVTSTDDAQRLHAILQRMEHEVAELHQEMELARKTHQRTLGSLTVAVSFIFLMAIVNPLLAGHLEGVFSGIGLTLLHAFRESKTVRHRIEKSPFYFPLQVLHPAKAHERRRF